jgi:signal transduction histidine kinase
VFNNLLDNAIKYSPAGGDVEIAITANAAHVFVTVADAGPGISDEALKTLFQPFASGRRTSHRGHSSTGLGLSIARRIVEGHGGSIKASSRENAGTVFIVSLPRLR